jgi:hypothetical protein
MANKKVSEFLAALASNTTMQAAWEADPEQCALDFGVSPGNAKKLAQAKASGDLTPILDTLKQEEGAQARMSIWIK